MTLLQSSERPPLLQEIREITCSASVSWGVIHEGEAVLTHTEGLRDVEQNLEADDNTAYLLASLTKAFISALCGLFVNDGILDWDKPISNYVPLYFAIDPEGSRRTTLRDVLSHPTGHAHMDLAWLGVESKTIIEKDDLLHVPAHLLAFTTTITCTLWLARSSNQPAAALVTARKKYGRRHFEMRLLYRLHTDVSAPKRVGIAYRSRSRGFLLFALQS